MSDLNRATVSILGESYTIRGEAEPGYIAEVAELVDARMRELRAASPQIPKARLAVLAAINLADELLQARRGKEAFEVERRTKQLISLLDEGLIGDTPE